MRKLRNKYVGKLILFTQQNYWMEDSNQSVWPTVHNIHRKENKNISKIKYREKNMMNLAYSNTLKQ